MSSDRGLCGLRNRGNTCFMNSALQSLNSVRVLREFFLSETFDQLLSSAGVTIRNDPQHDGFPFPSEHSLCYYYAQYLRSAWRSETAGALANDEYLHQYVNFALPQFHDGRQHDASEFIMSFLDRMHEELMQMFKRASNSTNDEHSSSPNKKRSFKDMNSNDEEEQQQTQEEQQQERRLQAWQTLLQNDQSVVTETFRGQMQSCVTCEHCNTRSITYEPFMYLSLEVNVEQGRHDESRPTPASNSSVEKKVRLHFFDHMPSKPVTVIDTVVNSNDKVGSLYMRYARELCANNNSMTRDDIIDAAVHLKLVRLHNGAVRHEFHEEESLSLLDEDHSLCLYHMQDFGSPDMFSLVHIDASTCSSLLGTTDEARKVNVCLWQCDERSAIGMPFYFWVPQKCSPAYLYECARRRMDRIVQQRRRFNKSRATRNWSSMFGEPYNNYGDAAAADERCDQMFELFVSDRYGVYVDDFNALPAHEKRSVDWMQEHTSRDTQLEQTLFLNMRWKTPQFDLCIKTKQWLSALFDDSHFRYYNEREAYARSRQQQEQQQRHGSNVPAERLPVIDIHDLIDSYTRVERLGDNEYYCERCETKRSATKRLSVSICPKTLIVFLKRFEYDLYGQMRSKLKRRIRYPRRLDTVLNLNDNVCEQERAQQLTTHAYTLVSEVLHRGTASSGHYEANCARRYDPNNLQEIPRWYRFNDTRVSTLDDLLPTNAAYILCFERLD